MITVKVGGVDGSKRNLRFYSAEVKSGVFKANVKTATEALNDVHETLRRPTPPRQFGPDQGDLSGRYHIKTRLGQTGGTAGDLQVLSVQPSNELSALVGAVSDHVLPVEFGRAPGRKPPPPGALKDWLRRHNLPESLDYVIAQSIARRGIAALPHLHPALERARGKHQQYIAEAMKEAGETTSRNADR